MEVEGIERKRERYLPDVFRTFLHGIVPTGGTLIFCTVRNTTTNIHLFFQESSQTEGRTTCHTNTDVCVFVCVCVDFNTKLSLLGQQYLLTTLNSNK